MTRFVRARRAGRRLLVLVGVLSVLSAVPGRAGESLRVGLYRNAPKVFMDVRGRAAGIFPELLEAVAARRGWTLHWVPGTWTGCLAALETGELDLMVDVSYSPARAERFRFNAEPVLSDWFQVYAHPGRKILSILDLEGRRIGVLKDSVQADSLSAMAEHFASGCALVPFEDYAHAFDDLARGELDAVVVNRYYGMAHRRADVVETPVVFHPTRLHLAAWKGLPEAVLAAFDEELRAMKADGGSVYYASLRRWTGERPRTALPAGFRRGLAVFAALLLWLWGWTLVLRWQVRRRTRELEKALAELARAQDEALRFERLRTMGQLSAGLAHDLNNVLGPVLGYADLLLEDSTMRADPAAIRDSLEIIRRAAEDGKSMVARMRALSGGGERDEGGALVPVDVAGAVRDAMSFTRGRREQRARSRKVTIDVALALPPDLPPVAARPGELREILTNLLLNAYDALAAGGTVRVEAELADGAILLAVADDGPGMSPEVLDGCTRPFFTTKGSEGTGLGLPMVRLLAERFGGTLVVTSAVGKGTRVALRLPRADRAASAAVPAGPSRS